MNMRRLITVVHRDLGYFMVGTILVFSVSGIALNHADDWNPNFVVDRRDVPLDLPPSREDVTRDDVLAALETLSVQEAYRTHDFPTDQRIKIYLKNGSVTGMLGSGHGEHETIRRRPFLYEANAVHINPDGWWLWFSDAFAVGLVMLAISGMFILRGRGGLAGRGKWLVVAGLVAPIIALLLV